MPDLSHREARPVSLGARSRPRELRALPRSARIQPRQDAGGEAAVPLPALPPQHPPSGDSLRRHEYRGRGRGEQSRRGARLQELPPERPRRQRALRAVPVEVAMKRPKSVTALLAVAPLGSFGPSLWAGDPPPIPKAFLVGEFSVAP